MPVHWGGRICNMEPIIAISKKYNIYEGNLIKDFLKIYNLAANLVSISKIINNPKKSVANPGKIKSNAAKANAAPEIIS